MAAFVSIQIHCCFPALTASPNSLPCKPTTQDLLLAPNVILPLDDVISAKYPHCWKAASQVMETVTVPELETLLSFFKEKKLQPFFPSEDTPPAAEALAAVWARRARVGVEPSRARCQSAPSTPAGDLQHLRSVSEDWFIHLWGHTAPEPHALFNTSNTSDPPGVHPDSLGRIWEPPWGSQHTWTLSPA